MTMTKKQIINERWWVYPERETRQWWVASDSGHTVAVCDSATIAHEIVREHNTRLNVRREINAAVSDAAVSDAAVSDAAVSDDRLQEATALLEAHVEWGSRGPGFRTPPATIQHAADLLQKWEQEDQD